MSQFTQWERKTIQEALSEMRNELSDDSMMVAEFDLEGPSALQDKYNWGELLTLLSAIKIHPKWDGDEMDRLDICELLSKVQKLAIDIFRDQRIQPCPNGDCNGYLIFLRGAGKVPLAPLIPQEYLEKLGPSFSEDMFGYIIAMCPWCHLIQIYNGV